MQRRRSPSDPTSHQLSVRLAPSCAPIDPCSSAASACGPTGYPALDLRSLDAFHGVPMSSDSFGRPADGPFQPSRRRFVQGLAAGGTVAGLGLWPRTSWAMKSPGQLTVLSGTEFDLAIGETLVNFTGRTRPADRKSVV